MLGEVFDVTAGRRFYAPPSHYSYFSGKDGSRAFVTGEFSNDAPRPGHDVSDLSDSQVIDHTNNKTRKKKQEKENRKKKERKKEKRKGKKRALAFKSFYE